MIYNVDKEVHVRKDWSQLHYLSDMNLFNVEYIMIYTQAQRSYYC